ncbi:C40 family peptidase [Niabella soli]|uniref:C40 family peptidase n=1 Tax=Niabella soli TaxID=446683 RepID=UPI00024995BA|nr:C40 family peptidase [Niabella soli]
MRYLLTGFSIVVLLTSCSTTAKIFGTADRKNVAKTTVTPQPPAPAKQAFMDQVTISPRNSKSDTRMARIEKTIASSEIKDISTVDDFVAVPKALPATQLQIKYASLLNMMPGSITNNNLLETLDNWYGTRYVYGGTSKRGIDCSAFTREMYRSAYGIELPRTAHEQYGRVRKISTTELKEGDLVFFNTTGGVSHVGLYLGNNKFAHASTSRGVTISDLYETYYITHYIGAGRIENAGSFYATVPARIAGTTN